MADQGQVIDRAWADINVRMARICGQVSNFPSTGLMSKEAIGQANADEPMKTPLNGSAMPRSQYSVRPTPGNFGELGVPIVR